LRPERFAQFIPEEFADGARGPRLGGEIVEAVGRLDPTLHDGGRAVGAGHCGPVQERCIAVMNSAIALWSTSRSMIGMARI
jgi:hypothetical protein